VAEAAVDVARHEDGEAVLRGAGGEGLEHGGDESLVSATAFDATVLIEEKNIGVAERLGAVDAEVERGGDAEVVTIFNQLEVESGGGGAERRELLGGGAVVDDDHVLELGPQGREVVEHILIRMKRDDDGT